VLTLFEKTQVVVKAGFSTIHSIETVDLMQSFNGK